MDRPTREHLRVALRETLEFERMAPGEPMRCIHAPALAAEVLALQKELAGPSTEQVEWALAVVSENGGGSTFNSCDGVHRVLAAEVVALREELAAAHAGQRAGLATIRETDRQLKELHAELAGQRNSFARLLVDYEALKRAERDQPSYSTEAVDALLEAWDDWDSDGDLVHVRNRVDAVRASREPPHESRAAKEQREGVTGPARFTASDGAVNTQPKPPLKA